MLLRGLIHSSPNERERSSESSRPPSKDRSRSSVPRIGRTAANIKAAAVEELKGVRFVVTSLANAGPDRIIDCDEPLIQLQGTGSVGSQYSYNWIKLIGGNIVSGGNTLTPTVNAPGTYRLVVTDSTNGCTAGNNAKVTANVLPPAISAIGGTYSCSVPSITIQSTTNANNPTFIWSGPNGFSSTDQNPVVNASGDYTVVVTDNVSGCTNAAIATVVANTDQPGAAATGAHGANRLASNSLLEAIVALLEDAASEAGRIAMRYFRQAHGRFRACAKRPPQTGRVC